MASLMMMMTAGSGECVAVRPAVWGGWMDYLARRRLGTRSVRQGHGSLRRVRRRWRWRCQAGMDLAAGVSSIQGLALGVGVGLPCTVMECGDVVYRSTLPSQGFQLTAPGVLLSLLLLAYLGATPGVAAGFWDMFVLARLEQLYRPTYGKEDLKLDKKLGEGAFGTVYKASALGKRQGELVVKKASEYGSVEVWMNQRVRRACASSCAEFVHGFVDSSNKGKSEEYWLVWKYEGAATLADLMCKKDFPYNLEEAMLGETASKGRSSGSAGPSPSRENDIIRAIMRQILSAICSLHETGIVHRDIKPQNIIFSEESKRFKIIDLGAAADLRVGINYVPKEFLLDPRYAAPEQYIMSTQTPSAPPAPVATFLAPVLWQMNLPDRFDVYSAGLIFLQLAFPNLRSDTGLLAFNRQLKRCDYDLGAWREAALKRPSADLLKGFQILDLDGGLGWDLLQQMIRFKSRQRISAKEALAHPCLNTAILLPTSFLQRLRLSIFGSASREQSELLQWVQSLMAKSGNQTVGGFTEIQLEELSNEAGNRAPRKATPSRNALASALLFRRKVARSMDAAVGEQRNSKKFPFFWWNQSGP